MKIKKEPTVTRPAPAGKNRWKYTPWHVSIQPTLECVNFFFKLKTRDALPSTPITPFFVTSSPMLILYDQMLVSQSFNNISCGTFSTTKYQNHQAADEWTHDVTVVVQSRMEFCVNWLLELDRLPRQSTTRDGFLSKQTLAHRKDVCSWIKF